MVLHCPSSASRFQAAKELLNYGFANFTLASPDPAVQIPPVQVILGKEQTVTPVALNSDPVLIEKGKQSSVSTQVEVSPQVKAPVEAGQQLGSLILSSNGTELTRIPLIAPEPIGRKTWWDVTKELFGSVCFCA